VRVGHFVDCLPIVGLIDALARGDGLEQQHISVELKRAEEDPPAHDLGFQQELGEFAKLLRLAGVAYSQREEVEYSTPEFLVTLSPELGSTFAMILMMWFQRRAGRSIRVTMFDDDVDLRFVKDFGGFVEKIKQTGDKTLTDEGASS
jgi:hypothetical protein